VDVCTYFPEAPLIRTLSCDTTNDKLCEEKGAKIRCGNDDCDNERSDAIQPIHTPIIGRLQMSIQDELRDKVKPELNHLYTESPRRLPDGSWDAGWFCREHALHLFVLARLAGFSSEILLGDYLVATPDRTGTTSLESPNEHAWCSVGDTVPVDISLTLKFMYPKAPDVAIVFGESATSPYEIRYYRNIEPQSVLNACSGVPSLIAYREREVFATEPVELLEHPYQFLFDPSAGCRKLTEIYGEDFFFQVTQHCYKLLTCQAKPLYPYRGAQSACRAIVNWNLDARSTITEALHSGR